MDYVTPPELKIDVSAKPFALSDATLARADGGHRGCWSECLPRTRRSAKLPHAGALAPAAAGAPARRPGCANPGVPTAESQSHAGRRRFRESWRVRLRTPRTGGQAGARSGETRRRPGAAAMRANSRRRASDSAALEASLSAVLAHAAPMPEQKSKPTPPCEVSRGRGSRTAASPEFDRSMGHCRRQSPRALARCPAAERARLRRVPGSAAEARACARAGRTASMASTAARASLMPGRSSPSPARIPTGKQASSRLTYKPEGAAQGSGRHRARRQGNLLRHGRHQPEDPSQHVHDARRHAGQLGGGGHAAGPDPPRGAVCRRLLARDHREPDRPDGFPAAGGRAAP